MEKVGDKATWRPAQCLLSPEEWRIFSNLREIDWSQVYKQTLTSGNKILPAAAERPGFDNESRHTTCPFPVRDVPCAIDPEGNPNLWVTVKAIVSKGIRAEWEKDIGDIDGFDWPTIRMLREILNNTDPETRLYHGQLVLTSQT